MRGKGATPRGAVAPRLRLVESARAAAEPVLGEEAEADGVAEPAHAPMPERELVRAETIASDDSVDEQTATRAIGRPAALSALMALPDARLVPIARTGDQLAREALYRKHASFAIHLATRIEGSARDVEDIAHDAFIKAFTHLADLADPAAFRSWLGSIVVFAVRSRLRRTRLMSMLGLGRGADPIDLDSIASSEASPHTRAQLAQIYALLRTLPTDERIAWTLRCVEGHELEVVAKLTRCSLATVKRRIGRAQRFLENHFVETPSETAVSEPPDSAGERATDMDSTPPNSQARAVTSSGRAAPERRAAVPSPAPSHERTRGR
ncbi:MAG: sigma-70 family RNA polymerase sigma factor [Polyangiaceae bacterium]